MQFKKETFSRAWRAWQCSPFRHVLFQSLRDQGIPLGHIVGSVGYTRGYTCYPLSERQAEDELMWLIQVGVLRREVDGQGITDSYRLAPLGRQLLTYAQERKTAPQWQEYGLNVFSRWLQLLPIDLHFGRLF
jgi:hypothetical protein